MACIRANNVVNFCNEFSRPDIGTTSDNSPLAPINKSHMPLYMDRHDMREPVTPEMIATIHLEDVKIQEQLGCRVLTYWFDEKRNTAFCLIEAPDEESIHTMHQMAHGQVPNTIIEVSPQLVEAFLGRIDDPEKPEGAELNVISESAFRTIMMVSLKQETSDQTRMSNQEIISKIRKHKGSIVKQTENCVLSSFASTSDAVHTALDIRNLLSQPRPELHGNRLELKIGLSAGVPVTGTNLFFENTIRQAERMCRVMRGEVIVSPGVKELYDNENPETLQHDENIFCMTELEEKFLTALMDFAEQHWDKTELGVDDISKALGYSKSQLYRKMTALTGRSPNEFMQEYRLDEAFNLLRKKAGNISEIAFRTGFSSPSYFTKCFKKRFGFAPIAEKVMRG